jgi:hypothetical protein
MSQSSKAAFARANLCLREPKTESVADCVAGMMFWFGEDTPLPLEHCVETTETLASSGDVQPLLN